ncbi:MAG: aldehyde dehydrogenase [Planctomycetia bacterium]|nr:MAG: aldehyde dehydrogenase [Planctomycetia bacterium]
MQRILNFVNGEPRPAISGGTLEVHEPAVGRAYALAPDSDARDLDSAIVAAEQAFPAWSRSGAESRSNHLLAIAAAIESRMEEFARAESIDTGKPIALARTMDIPRSVRNFRFFATAVLHERNDAHVTNHAALNYTLRRPRGVVGLISPWNLPLYLLSWKIAPALAVGNTAVAKPSEIAPMTAHLLADVCRQTGLPPGVLNVVHGLGPKVGGPIASDPRLGTISFTGGTVTGRSIALAAAPHFKKLALEMGGKNATVVFADADFEQAVSESVRAAFANQGQVCLCGSRVLVEKSIYAQFTDAFVQRTRALRIGDPLDEATTQGALSSQAHLDKVKRYVALARAEGGRIICGDDPIVLPERCRNGWFHPPTVIVGLDPHCGVNQEEIFGPVVTLSPFSNDAEAVSLANSTIYGLSASLWTRDLNRALRVSEQLDVGTVWVNCWLLRDLRVPFGGTKQSGLGREGGEEALHFFTEPKNVCVRTTA